MGPIQTETFAVKHSKKKKKDLGICKLELKAPLSRKLELGPLSSIQNPIPIKEKSTTII